MGLVVEKLNRGHMLDVARRAGVNVSPNATATDIARALQQSYRVLPPSKLSGCDECHGESPTALPGCAFCGIADEENQVCAQERLEMSRTRVSEEDERNTEAATPTPESTPEVSAKPANDVEPQAHDAAQLFPPLHDVEFDELVADIKEHGQREAVVMLGDLILDGRNRWRACKRAGIEPRRIQWAALDVAERGSSPVTFVLSRNLRRRHLEPGQRAALAAKLVPMFEGEAAERKRAGQVLGGQRRRKLADQPAPEAEAGTVTEVRGSSEEGRAVVLAAREANAGINSTKAAVAIEKADPEVFKDLEAGKVSVAEAKRKVASKKRASGPEKSAATPVQVNAKLDHATHGWLMQYKNALDITPGQALAEVARKFASAHPDAAAAAGLLGEPKAPPTKANTRGRKRGK